MNDDHQDARMILALAAEVDDEFIWDRIRMLQTEMFAAGPVADQVCLLRREGALPESALHRDALGRQTLTTWPTSWTGAGLAACAAAMSESAISSSRRYRKRDRGLFRPWLSSATIFTATLMTRLLPPSSCARREPDCSCFSKVARILRSVHSGFSRK